MFRVRDILMYATDCPFLPDIYHTFSDEEYLYIVMEYINSGSLNEKINALDENKGFPIEAVKFIAAQIILTLQYL